MKHNVIGKTNLYYNQHNFSETGVEIVSLERNSWEIKQESFQLWNSTLVSPLMCVTDSFIN